MERKRAAGAAAAVAGLAAAGYIAWRWRRAMDAEMARLATLLGWQPGRVVADVGAGRGSMARAAARRVAPGGKVLATEIEPKKIARLRRKGPANLQALAAGDSDPGLPEACCDAMVLRGSYHHLTRPAAVTAALYRALRPGGAVAVIDFHPRWWLTLFAPVKDVPQDRGGHGIPRDVLIREMTQAGFQVESIFPRWLPAVYCVLFRKPA